MGGSRRRNVPDQMEQPMMRNEHIVRDHKTPEVAINPATGTPWKVIHVNNAVATSGNGSDASPVKTLAEASAIATNAWDIVFVHQGLSRTTTPYGGTFDFGNQNQYLVGDGAGFALPSVCCVVNLSTGAGFTPLLSNPAGDSVFIDGAIAGGATVANLDILGSKTGIYATGNLTGLPSVAYPAGQPTLVQNVTISGNDTSASQSGAYLDKASGNVTFTDTAIANMTDRGLVITGTGAAALNLDYQGSITSDTSLNGGAVSPIIYIADVQTGAINIATGGGAIGSNVPNAVSDTGGSGIQIVTNAVGTTINIGNVSLKDNAQTAISLFNDDSTTTISADSGKGIQKATNGAAISVIGGSPSFEYIGPITNGLPNAGGTTSYLLSVAGTLGGDVTLTATGSPFVDTGNGISINDAGGDVTIAGLGASIASSGAQGVLIDGPNSTGTFLFTNVTITDASQAGVLINQAPGSTEFQNLNIKLAQASATGFQAVSSGQIIASVGSNTIANASTTQAAVDIVGSGALNLNFSGIESGNTTIVPGTPTALMFNTSPGSFNVTSIFTVGGVAGSTANVTNDGTTTVTLPP